MHAKPTVAIQIFGECGMIGLKNDEETNGVAGGEHFLGGLDSQCPSEGERMGAT